jgi:hypothetical protein
LSIPKMLLTEKGSVGQRYVVARFVPSAVVPDTTVFSGRACAPASAGRVTENPYGMRRTAPPRLSTRKP